MSFDDAVPADGAPSIVFVAALGIECASLRRRAAAGAPWRIEQSGPGPQRAAAAAARALEAGAKLLVSWGLAGALDAAVAPGTVLVPRRIVTAGGETLAVDGERHAALAALAGELVVAHGDLLTVAAALELPAAKRAAARTSGAVAVDMESAAIAAAAARAGVPFVALRVIVDGVDDALPKNAERWVNERGERRLAPALRAAVAVHEWRGLLTLAKRYRLASRVLEQLARVLADRGLLEARAGAGRGARS
jgi:adenosylhomocysteine nucleosidase